MIDISIIIPFKNQFLQLQRCICGILNQKIEMSYEIVILDSSDFSLESAIISLDSRINYFRILPDSFNHGMTRNQGVEFSNGKILVFTVQDSVAFDTHWLHNLVSPLIRENLDAICGMQIVDPKNHTNPIFWYRPTDEPSIRIININGEIFTKLSSIEKQKYTGWDNVNSAYTKQALLSLPFRDMMFGEDAQWAVDAIINDFRIAYTSFSVVYHDHPFDFEFSIKRYLAEYYTQKKTINADPLLPQVHFKTILRWLVVLWRSTKNPFRIIYWIIITIQQERSKKLAYNYWIKVGFSRIENFLVHNVPISNKR
jgi:glycosyltransferase involved in cell wall biosynthesis